MVNISSPLYPATSHRKSTLGNQIFSSSSDPQHGSFVTQWLSACPVALPLQAGAASLPDWCPPSISLPVPVKVVCSRISNEMSEREAVEVCVCPRPDLPHRSHKNTARNKGIALCVCVTLGDGALLLVLSTADKHSNSGSYGRRSHLESPPTFGYPSRHPHHHPSPRGSWNKSREREKRRGGRDRVDETSRGKVCVCQYLV